MSQASLFDLMPQRRVWKVSELTECLGELLERAFRDIWIEGEVSNYRPAQSGHLYFTLKDSRSQIRCVCFRDQARTLKFRPEDGLHITVRGSLGVYEVRGEYQVYVTHIEPVGLGALQLAFEQLKKKLQEEGLFDEARKKPLPVLPRCIGVVTSPAGAAIRDILRVLKRRFANVHVQLYPVKVQGEGAAGEIVAGLRYFNRAKFADVVILARGGGSLEDLWAFNEETVARAIAASAVPVISGVGHETDFTIADFVADLRAPTPSAAAEIVVRSRQEFDRHIADHQRNLVQQMRYLLSQRRHRVRDLQSHRGFRQMDLLVRRRRQQLDELGVISRRDPSPAARCFAPADHPRRRQNRILRFAGARHRVAPPHSPAAAKLCAPRSNASPTRKQRRFGAVEVRFAALDLRARVGKLRRALDERSRNLRVQIDRALIARRRKLEAAALQLEERSPFQLLQRGYAIAYDASGKVLRSPDQVALGDDISLRLAQGALDATVRRKRSG